MFSEIKKPEAVFFDLDGTLLDTAQDFAHAINIMLAQRKKPPLNFNTFRKHVHGDSKKMVSFAFDIEQTHPEFEILRDEFLRVYHANSTHKTVFFPGMAELLILLDEKKIPWGIITNKPSWLTKPIASHFKFDQRAVCVISGDTLATCKPDPFPLQHACAIAKANPAASVYIGDMHTDILTAKNAGLKSIAVTYGYHPPDTIFHEWQADCVAKTTDDIIHFLHIKSTKQ